MRLHQLAHQIQFLIVRECPEYRRELLLDYVVSGFDEFGRAIEHAQYQTDIFHCLDCPKSGEECKDCSEVSRNVLQPGQPG